MVKLHEFIVGIDAAIFMHPQDIWEAFGPCRAVQRPADRQQEGFKEALPADVLIEDWLAKQGRKDPKEVEKARKRFGEPFDEAKYRETSPPWWRPRPNATR